MLPLFRELIVRSFLRGDLPPIVGGPSLTPAIVKQDKKDIDRLVSDVGKGKVDKVNREDITALQKDLVQLYGEKRGNDLTVRMQEIVDGMVEGSIKPADAAKQIKALTDPLKKQLDAAIQAAKPPAKTSAPQQAPQDGGKTSGFDADAIASIKDDPKALRSVQDAANRLAIQLTHVKVNTSDLIDAINSGDPGKIAKAVQDAIKDAPENYKPLRTALASLMGTANFQDVFKGDTPNYECR